MVLFLGRVRILSFNTAWVPQIRALPFVANHARKGPWVRKWRKGYDMCCRGEWEEIRSLDFEICYIMWQDVWPAFPDKTNQERNVISHRKKQYVWWQKCLFHCTMQQSSACSSCSTEGVRAYNEIVAPRSWALGHQYHAHIFPKALW